MDLHQLAMECSLYFHRLIAQRIRRDPAILERVRKRVRMWLAETPDRPYVREWEKFWRVMQSRSLLSSSIGARGPKNCGSRARLRARWMRANDGASGARRERGSWVKDDAGPTRTSDPCCGRDRRRRRY